MRIQDLVTGGSDKRPPTLYNCLCYLTSPFSQEKVWPKYLRLFHFGALTEPPEPPLDPPQGPVARKLVNFNSELMINSE